MSGKVRVHELAKTLGLSNSDLLEFLAAEGFEVSSHLAALDNDLVGLVTEHYADAAAAAVVEGEEDDIVDEEQLVNPRHRHEEAHRSRPRKGRDDDDAKSDRPLVDPASDDGRLARASTPKEIHLKQPIIVKELAIAMGLKPNVLIHDLMMLNVLASINQAIDVTMAEKICTARGVTLVAEKRAKHGGMHAQADDSVAPEDRVHGDERTEPRPPVIALIGHVDHGKTSLLDAIRRTRMVKGESGGITQHIGAWSVERNGHKMTFIDTPGHAAFENMRARGAQVTDIVVLVVAADDGFMPQTIEGLRHVKAAGVQLVVAMNKIDLPSANKDRILTQMQHNDLFPEDWGGNIAVMPVSATEGTGVDELLDRLLLESEMMELRANPNLPVKAVVIEAQVEQGLGVTASLLIKNGTLSLGDYLICGEHYGKVKALIDGDGNRLKSAGPSTPCKVVGLSGMPECGSIVVGSPTEKDAKRLTAERVEERRQDQLTRRRNASLDDLFRQIEEEARKELKVVIKADVQGTSEAIRNALEALATDKIRLTVVQSGVGSISENDVLMAAAADAILIGFHVRVNAGVNQTAKREGVDIRLFSVIYEVIAQIREGMEGMLDPDVREEAMGRATILQVFSNKNAKICGCSVGKGVVRVGAKARVTRAGELIYNGSISSLRRFQDDVKEVRQGLECGIRLDNFNDFEVDDEIEVYDYIKTKATL